jgi:type I restriction enzyme S subunit
LGFPADSIVFAKVGAAVFLERKKILGQPSCIDNNMAAYVLDASRADVRFVHSLLLMKKLGALVATTALPALNGKQLAEMVLALPPLPEQRVIAAALSDVDALLATLDQVIAKKRDLKQAAMQQLLTGKTRLPGFSGPWDVKQIGEFTDCTAGGTPSTLNSAYWGGEIPWMSSGELHLKRVQDVEGRITKLGLNNSSTKIIPSRCVLIGLAGQGKTRGTAAINLIELCTNQSIAAIFPNKSFNSE